MLYKVMHNQSTKLTEDHLKCLVERSWFISEGDFIEKKTKKPHHLGIIIPPRKEEP